MNTNVPERSSRFWVVLFLALSWLFLQGCGGNPQPTVVSPAPPEKIVPPTPKDDGPKEQSHDFKRKKSPPPKEYENNEQDCNDTADINCPGAGNPGTPPPAPSPGPDPPPPTP